MRALREAVSRREFGLALVAIGAAGCATTPVLRAQVDASGTVVLDRAAVDRALADNGALTVSLVGQPAILLLQNGGERAALSSHCPHLGCAVRVGQHALSCPCHASTFDREGRVTRGPSPADLERFEIREVGTELHIIAGTS